MTHGGRQTRAAAGWRPGEGDPFPVLQANIALRPTRRLVALRSSIWARQRAPGAAGGRGRGTPEGPREVCAVPRGEPLRSEGGTQCRGVRLQGRRALGEAGFWGLHAQGFGVESSQTPGRLGCRHPRPSPLPPSLPPASSRAGAAPGLCLEPLAEEKTLEDPRVGVGSGSPLLGGTLPQPPLLAASAPPRPRAPPRPCRAAHSPRSGREPRGPSPPPPECPPCAPSPPPRCSSCCSCWGCGSRSQASRSRRRPRWSLPSWPAMRNTRYPTTWARWSGWTTPGPGWPSGERPGRWHPLGICPQPQGEPLPQMAPSAPCPDTTQTGSSPPRQALHSPRSPGHDSVPPGPAGRPLRPYMDPGTPTLAPAPPLGCKLGPAPLALGLRAQTQPHGTCGWLDLEWRRQEQAGIPWDLRWKGSARGSSWGAVGMLSALEEAALQGSQTCSPPTGRVPAALCRGVVLPADGSAPFLVFLPQASPQGTGLRGHSLWKPEQGGVPS